MIKKEKDQPGLGWLLFCAGGMISSLTLYGIVLEYATSGGRKLHEVSFIFVTTSIYATTAYIARGVFGEKRSTDISKHQMLMISLMSIASAYTSVRSLRYVIYPVQVLFKSCKPVPVMIFGLVFGQKYSFQKYVNVIIITIGVALFMGGGNSTLKKVESSNANSAISDTTILGAALLSVSLCFDGATGAYEDKLMSGQNSIGPYDLMFNIQLGKAVISFCALIVANGVNDFVRTVQEGGIPLVVLGLTGALGQVFLFITISKFGALNCALLGLLRKMLSLMLSFLVYGHTLNAPQTVGLVLSVAAMSANFLGKDSSRGHGHKHDDEATSGDKREGRSDVKINLRTAGKLHPRSEDEVINEEEEEDEEEVDEEAPLIQKHSPTLRSPISDKDLEALMEMSMEGAETPHDSADPPAVTETMILIEDYSTTATHADVNGKIVDAQPPAAKLIAIEESDGTVNVSQHPYPQSPCPYESKS